MCNTLRVGLKLEHASFYRQYKFQKEDDKLSILLESIYRHELSIIYKDLKSPR